jgi:leader peptidase (prepilin peptidase)/N-methyltransferase
VTSHEPRYLDARHQRAAAGAVAVAVEAGLAWRIGLSVALPAFAYLGLVGTTVSVIDLHARRLPNRLVLPSYPVTLALLAVAAGVDQDWWPLARAVIAAAVVAGFYLALELAFPLGLGLGDAKFGGLLALALGWLGWAEVDTGVLAAWWLAALVVVGRSLARRGALGGTPALGPWLGLGALVAVVVR